MIASATETKFCESCLFPKPVEEFRLRSRSGSRRKNQCRSCHNEIERLRARRQSKLRDRRRMAASLTELKNAPTNRRVEILCATMCEQYGGLQGVVASWMKYDEHARRQPGAYANFRSIMAILRLHQYCAEQPPADFSDMSDEELERELLDDRKRFLRANPQFAADALKACGWTVIPPSDAGDQSCAAGSAIAVQ